MVEEFDVFSNDPAATTQHPEVAIYSTAERKAWLLSRKPRLEDAIFAFWGWCWPGLPQDGRYTEFMRHIHAVLFHNVEKEVVRERAASFFSEEFSTLGLDDCVRIVTNPGILDLKTYGRRIPIGRRIRMFDVSMLPAQVQPRWQGDIILEPLNYFDDPHQRFLQKMMSIPQRLMGKKYER